MATSGSVDFSVSRDNIIMDALLMVGGMGVEDSAPTAGQTTHSARVLNAIAKEWQVYGCQLWARKTGYILPQSSTNEIDLGPSGDEATLSFTLTQLASDAASGASTIEVDSITGISSTNRIGIELDDGTIQWTTVNGAPSGTTVTLTTALTGAADTDGFVYVYATKLQRPLRITDAFLRTYTSSTEYTEHEIAVVPRLDYERLGNKLSTGPANQIAYEPLLTDGRAYIYPRFGDGNAVVKVVFQRPFEDFDASGDTPDFPSEWYLALVYALAVVLAPTYGYPVQDRAALRAEAMLHFGIASLGEPEEGSFKIQPERA
jgi:hypothetical protein